MGVSKMQGRGRGLGRGLSFLKECRFRVSLRLGLGLGLVSNPNPNLNPKTGPTTRFTGTHHPLVLREKTYSTMSATKPLLVSSRNAPPH